MAFLRFPISIAAPFNEDCSVLATPGAGDTNPASAADLVNGFTAVRITIPAGQTSANLDLAIVADAVVEPNEQVKVTLSAPLPAGSSIASGASVGFGTISNDDASSQTFTMAQLPDQKRVYQRSTEVGGSANKGQGTVAVTVNVTTAGPIFARLRSAADGTTITQASWQAIANAPVANGPVNITGVDAILGWHYLDTAPTINGPWQLGTTQISVGAITLMTAAQSLGVRMFKNRTDESNTIAGAGVTVNPNGVVYAKWFESGLDFTAPTFAPPSDAGPYTGAGAAEYLDGMVKRLGVNHCYAGAPTGAIGAAWYARGGPGFPALKSIAEKIGGWEFAQTFIGHSDAANNASLAEMRTSLSAVAEAILPFNHRAKNFRTTTMSIPNTTFATPEQIERIRKALYIWTVQDSADHCTGGYSYANTLTAELYDNAHQTQAGGVTIAKAMVASHISNYMGDADLTGTLRAPNDIHGTPAFANAGKFRAKALDAGTGFQWGTGEVGAGTTTRAAWLYLTAAPTGDGILFGESGRSWVMLRGDRSIGSSIGLETPAGAVPLNTWTYVSLETSTQDFSTNGDTVYNRLYINGVKVAESAAIGEYQAGGSFGVAQFGSSTDYPLTNTRLSELAIWNKAKGSYIPTAALTGGEPRLINYLSLNGNLTPGVAAASAITFASRQGWDYEDNFDGTPEALVNRPNWSATTHPDWKVRDSAAYKGGKFDPSKYASFGPTFDQNDSFEYEIDYDKRGIDPNETDNVGAGQHYNTFATDDAENGYGANIGFDGVTFQLGTQARWYQPSAGPGIAGGAYPKRGTLKVRLQGGYVYAAVSGHWITKNIEDYTDYESKVRTGSTGGVYDVSKLQLGTKTAGRAIGFRHDTWGNPVADGVRIRRLKVHVIDIQRFCSRRAPGATEGDIKLSGWFTGAPARWVYRLVLAKNLNTEVQAFRELGDLTTSGNNWSGKMSVPVGGPYVAEVGYIGTDNILYSDKTRRFSCGRKIAVFGQSNANGRLMRNEEPEEDVTFCGGATQTAELSNYPATRVYGNATGEYGVATQCHQAAMQLSKHLGEPCIIMGTAQNASGLDAFFPGKPAYDRLAEYLNRVPGILDAIIHDGHENNSDGTSGGDGWTGRVDYYNDMKDTYIPGIRAIGDTPNPGVLFFLAPPGRYASDDPTNGPNGPWATIDHRRDQLKLAKLDLEATPGLNVRVSSAKNGVDHGPDAYHYMGGEQGTVWNTRRDCQTIANTFNPAIPDGRGPIITGITRSGATITLAVNKNGAASLTGFLNVDTGTRPLSSVYKANTFKCYQFSTDNFATLLPVTSMTVSGDTIIATLASAPSGPVKMRSFYGASWDDREMIYGAGYTDGRRDLPVYPVYVPLVSN